eukprot:29026-Pelagococcus_subviridis.AAC.18
MQRTRAGDVHRPRAARKRLVKQPERRHRVRVRGVVRRGLLVVLVVHLHDRGRAVDLAEPRAPRGGPKQRRDARLPARSRVRRAHQRRDLLLVLDPARGARVRETRDGERRPPGQRPRRRGGGFERREGLRAGPLKNAVRLRRRRRRRLFRRAAAAAARRRRRWRRRRRQQSRGGRRRDRGRRGRERRELVLRVGGLALGLEREPHEASVRGFVVRRGVHERRAAGGSRPAPRGPAREPVPQDVSHGLDHVHVPARERGVEQSRDLGPGRFVSFVLHRH